MFPATGGRILGAVLATALGLAISASALAEPTKVIEIKGKKLFLYKTEAGKRVDWVNSADVDVTPPLDILGISAKGKFLVEIPGKGKFWILKAQTITDAGAPRVPVDCQNITKSYATSRALGDCN